MSGGLSTNKILLGVHTFALVYIVHPSHSVFSDLGRTCLVYLFSSLFIVLFSVFSFFPCLSLSQTQIHAYVGKIKASPRVGHLKRYTPGQYTRSLIVLFINYCFSCASKRRAPTLVKRAR